MVRRRTHFASQCTPDCNFILIIKTSLGVLGIIRVSTSKQMVVISETGSLIREQDGKLSLKYEAVRINRVSGVDFLPS